MKENKAKNEATPPRKPLFFRTLNTRVGFTVLLSVVLTIGAVLFGALWIRPIVGSDNVAIGATAALICIAVWIGRVAGDVLISRRARRVAHTMLDIVAGDKQPYLLPLGLGELDLVTSQFMKLSEDTTKLRETLEKQVKARTSTFELNQGLAELQKARIEALLVSIGEGVAACDKEGKISFVNAAARKDLWWKAPEVADVPIHSAFRLEDEKENIIPQEKWPTREVIETGRTVNTSAPSKPYYLRRQDMSRVPIKMTISPIKLGSDIAGAMVIMSDITREVEFDRVKSEFISIASHQLRSPTAAIKMMSDLLRKGDFGPMTDKQQPWVEKLFIASDALAVLVNELLNVSRLEAGVKMEVADTDPAAFVDTILKQTEPWLLEKRQKFAFNSQPVPVLAFDNFMIGEVLKNLLSNANKYSPEDGTITVTVEPWETGARISVKDQGMGIPQADHQKMFNKFFRAENATRSPIKGTGLGLYYCKTAVEKHGGQIGFDSAEGQGSTFWFTLPAKPPAAT